MSAVLGFDAGPLAWVKPEIVQALNQAATGLDEFFANPKEPAAQLKAAAAQLHQVSGAIQIIGLDGLNQFSEEIERLVNALAKGEIKPSAQVKAAVDRAMEAVSHYLDDLSNGGANMPLRLFPLYRDLQQARGLAASSEADLFFPVLDVGLPKNAEAAAMEPAASATLVKTQRAKYQGAMLKWVKNDSPGESLQAMLDAVLAVENAQALPAHRCFWWLAAGLIESQMKGGLPPEINIKPLFPKIDVQMKLLADGAHKVAERQLRDMLFALARSRPVSERVNEIKRLYRLDDYLPGAALPGAGRDQPLFQELRELLSQAKDAWEKFASGSTVSLEQFKDAVASLAQKSARADAPALTRLVSFVKSVADHLGARPQKPTERVALEMATTLVLVDGALNPNAQLGAEFNKQVEAMGSRIKAALSGQQVAKEVSAVPLLDALSRRVEEKHLLNQVVNEIQANLQHIESVLDAFFRDESKRSDLPSLEPSIKQIMGALQLMELHRAMELLQAAQGLINVFSEPESMADPYAVEMLAYAIGSLGLYIDAVKNDRPDRNEILAPVLKRFNLPTEEPEAATEAATEAAPETAAPIADFELPPIEAAPAQAEPAAPPAPGESLEAMLEPQTAKLEPPAPSEQAAQLKDASAAEVDAELLAVFLEEAQGVLAAIGDNLERCRAQPHDIGALTTVRRSFHTLKGSGRMVGLTDLGEVAWAVEQTLNKWLQEGKPAAPPLLALVSGAQAAFSFWVDALTKTGQVKVAAPDILKLAEQLRGDIAPGAELLAAVSRPFAAAGEAPLAAPAPPAAPEIAPPPAQLETAPEPDIAIGTLSFSPALFNLFLNEAQSYVETLARELGLMRENGGVGSHEFMRAAHTLCGICRSTGFTAVAELGSALEQLANALMQHAGAAAQVEACAQAVSALAAMVAAIGQKTSPQPQPAVLAIVKEQTAQLVAAFEVPPAKEAAPAPGPATIARAAPAPGPESTQVLKLKAQEAAIKDRRVIRDDVDSQLLPIFLEEAQELFPTVGTELRHWQQHPSDTQAPQDLQRTLHTLKGSARMAGAMRLGELTHMMESQVIAAVDSRAVGSALFDELLGLFDRLGAVLETLQTGQPEAPAPLEAVLPQTKLATLPTSVKAAPPPLLQAAMEKTPQRPLLRVYADIVDRLVNEAGEVAIARSRIETEMQEIRKSITELSDNLERLRGQLREIEIQAETQIQSGVVPGASEQFDPLEFDRFTRLQELTRFMAESVHDVGTVQQVLTKALDETDAAVTQQARMNRDLQQELMRIRMVPFASIEERLYRVVRQTAKELDKKANLEIRGGNVELDRSVLEKMTAPFEHLLRNAIVHGLENPLERVANGKPEIGEISIESRQEGNEIVFVFRDDGAGINVDKLREKGLQQGLLKPGESASDQQIMQFIFTQGVSTAETVTEIAGRGVGMDVVRNDTVSLGGRIEVDSERGKGATFAIHLPLTLAVTQAVMVRAGGKLYAIPSIMVEQVQEHKPDALAQIEQKREIEWLGNRFPFFYLPRLLGEAQPAVQETRRHPVLLLRSGALRAAVLVDELIGNREVVVKNVGPQLARLSGIAGATVLGNGEVVLIINPAQLAQRPSDAATTPAKPAAAQPAAQAAPLVMIVDDSLTVRKITSRFLERGGYRVATAKDGVDALEQLQEVKPDVMLVDIEMPRMDGFDLTRNVRADPNTRGIPIIMITSRTADKHKDFAMGLGVNVYLGKPYQEEQLMGQIAGLLKSRA